MRPAYATLCGITHEELTEVFTPELHQLGEANKLSFEETLEEMTVKYDGYRFSKNAPSIFNPFSVLNAFRMKKFGDYWFGTGTPTFLVDLLKESDYDLRTLINGVEATPQTFTEYRAEASNPIPVFYQSGYLTIKDYDPKFKSYTLRFPNDEVKYAFLQFLIPYYTTINENEQPFHIEHFVRELESGDVPSFMTRLQAFFADSLTN